MLRQPPRPPADAIRRARLAALLRRDRARRSIVRALAALRLPDFRVAAGFMRDAVWDRLHRLGTRAPIGDVDVLRFCRAWTARGLDRRPERALARRLPGPAWSVKNQARMHRRNRDAPHRSVADAMRRWPKTATAVAVRWNAARVLDVSAPLGLADLFAERTAAKRWTDRYPLLRPGAGGSRRSGRQA